MLFSRQFLCILFAVVGLLRASEDLLVCAGGSGSFLRLARGPPRPSSLAAAPTDSVSLQSRSALLALQERQDIVAAASPAAAPQPPPAASPPPPVPAPASTPQTVATEQGKPANTKPTCCGGGESVSDRVAQAPSSSTTAAPLLTTPAPAGGTPGGTPGGTTAASPAPAPTGPKPNVDNLKWEDVGLTAYWDCSSNGWNCNHLPASQKQQPHVPTAAERTKEYGEDLWITGAASDSLKDRGPGKKCYLIRGVGANPDFRVLAMLTNWCPGGANPACTRPKLHIDVAAPGWDNMKYSAAQSCGQPGKIGQKESGAINNWIMNPDDPGWKTGKPPGTLTWAGWSRPERTTFFKDRCKELKNGYDKGCLNFIKWGWKEGNPQAKFAQIPCPKAWVQKTGCPDR